MVACDKGSRCRSCELMRVDAVGAKALRQALGTPSIPFRTGRRTPSGTRRITTTDVCVKWLSGQGAVGAFP